MSRFLGLAAALFALAGCAPRPDPVAERIRTLQALGIEQRRAKAEAEWNSPQAVAEREHEARRRQPRRGFDIEQENLPPRYTGDDLRAVLVALRRAGLEEHRPRSNEVISRFRVGELDSESRFAFSFPANFKRWQQDIPTSGRVPDYFEDLPIGASQRARGAIILTAQKRETGRYLATNAFGAVATVSRTEATGLGVSVCPYLTSGIQAGQCISFSRSSLRLAFSADEVMPANARALLIGTLTPPYVETGGVRAAPTLDFPQDRRELFHLVSMRVEQIWLYDFSTGRVLQRIPVPAGHAH